MPDENELDLERLDQDIERNDKVEKRIKDLSEKVRLASEERDAKEKMLAQERAEKESLQKERDFLNSFGDALVKYPKASGFRDEIKEKVLKGYSVEDATIATLATKGEFTPAAPKVVSENPAGGSASVTPPTMTEQKPISQMSRDEKRDALLKAEERGDIYIS